MTFQHHIVERSIGTLRPYKQNARRHSRKQVRQIADSLRRFGITNPVLISDEGDTVAGHGRVEAARLLGMKTVPTIALSHLGATERRAHVLGDNKLALNVGWDQEVLALELQGLLDIEFDPSVTGFSVAEIDLVLDAAKDSEPTRRKTAEDWLSEVGVEPVSRQGDLWQLGRHRLICGEARKPDDRKRNLAWPHMMPISKINPQRKHRRSTRLPNFRIAVVVNQAKRVVA